MDGFLPLRRPAAISAGMPSKAEQVGLEEIEFIRAARGRLSTYDLGVCYGVLPQTISTIWCAAQ